MNEGITILFFTLLLVCVYNVLRTSPRQSDKINNNVIDFKKAKSKRKK